MLFLIKIVKFSTSIIGVLESKGVKEEGHRGRWKKKDNTYKQLVSELLKSNCINFYPHSTVFFLLLTSGASCEYNSTYSAIFMPIS